MFGSRRAKATRIKGSPGVFDGLQISCDNSHPHLSWKPVRVSGRWVYPTKDEAECTPDLCHFLRAQASAAVSSPLASRPSSSRAKMLRAAVRASAGHQTRSMPPLIPEFKCTMRFEEDPPGCDVKVFPSADSSVTGEKADIYISKASFRLVNGIAFECWKRGQAKSLSASAPGGGSVPRHGRTLILT